MPIDEIPDLPGYQDAMKRISQQYKPLSWADTIPRMAFPEGVMAALESVAAKLGAERAAAENALTESQFVEALRQALLAGDFVKYCTVGKSTTVDGRFIYQHLQTVTYEPFREVERLKARIAELEEKITDLERDVEDKQYGEDL